MVKKIFGVFVVIVLTISAINAMLYYRLKGTISNKTEEKYVRNFEKYKLLNDHIASTKDNCDICENGWQKFKTENNIQ